MASEEGDGDINWYQDKHARSSNVQGDFQQSIRITPLLFYRMLHWSIPDNRFHLDEHHDLSNSGQDDINDIDGIRRENFPPYPPTESPLMIVLPMYNTN
ncbi:hypothetical protein ACQP3R_05325 [Bacillus inaquosorum]|uniref:hypothetical protein n=1 Tax=Bacillus inaquosorum TaxID=483913 RepID=UPI003D04D5B1